MTAKRRVAPRRKQRAHDSFPKVHPDKWEWYAGSFGNGFDSATVNYSGVLTVSFYRTPAGLLNRYVRYDFDKLEKYYSALRGLQWKMTEDPGRSKGAPSSNMTAERIGSLGDIDGKYSDFCGLLSPGLLCLHDPDPSAPEGEWCGSHDFKCAKCGAAKGRDIWAGSAYCLPGIVTADSEQREALLKFWLAWARARSASQENRGANLTRAISSDKLRELYNHYKKHLSAAQVCYRLGKKNGLERNSNGLDASAANADIIEHYKDRDATYAAQYSGQAPKYSDVRHSPTVSEAMAAILPWHGGRGAKTSPKQYALQRAWEMCKTDRESYPVNSLATLSKHFRLLK